MKKFYLRLIALFVIILSLTFQNKVNAQFCAGDVPVVPIDFTGYPDTTWTLLSQPRNGLCCAKINPNRCVMFVITMDVNQQGIKLNSSGGPAMGSGGIQVSCDPSYEYSFNEPICLSGIGPHYITLCKPGGNLYDYYITGIAKPEASPPIAVSDGCTDLIYASGYVESSITWISLSPGAVGDYNSYLSCDTACDTTIVTAQPGYPSSILYQVTGNPIGGCASMIVTDTVRVHFITDKTATILPENPTVCFGGTNTTISANGTGGAEPYSYLWSTGETSQTISVGVGTYWVEISDTTNCPPVYDTVAVTANPSLIDANAGPDLMSCADNPSVTLQGSVVIATGGRWSGGAGTYSPNDSTLNAVYTPSAGEITTGSVNLVLTTTGNGTCPLDRDTMKVTITPKPSVNAGFDISVCANNPVASLNGFVDISTGGKWTTLGSGTFANDSSLTTTYTASSGDISLGGVSLILTTTGNGGCQPITDTLRVTITPAPNVYAGSDTTVCKNNPNLAVSGTVTVATTYSWTTTGSGSFSSPGSLNTTYISSSGDTSAGTVKLILTSSATATGCNPVSDTLTIIYTNPPTVNAGPATTTVCANNATVSLSGTVVGATGGQWFTSGSGTFGNTTSLTTTYTPSSADISAGSVNLFLRSTGNGNCLFVQDNMLVMFSTAPTSNAGPAALTVCGNNATVSLSGTVTVATGGKWTTNGSGTFAYDTSLTTTYTPSNADTAAGTIKLYLTTTGNGTCNAVTDSIIVTITDAPTVNAGSDQTVCANNATVSLTGSATNALSTVWSRSGTGTLTSPGTLNTNYIPSNTDTANGSVTITLTVPANAGCIAVSDNMTLIITDAPTVNAGPDTVLCGNNADVPLSGKVSVATGGEWSSSGTGTFTFPLSLITTYQPSSADTAAGSVYLTLKSTGNNNCSVVKDSLRVTFTDGPMAYAGSDKTVCANGGPVTISGSVSVATGGIWSRIGSGEGGTFASTTSLSTTYTLSNDDTTAGFVNLVLTTTGNGSCNAVKDTVRINISPAPVTNFSAAIACLAEPTQFTNQSVGVISSYLWNFGDGNTSSLANPTNTYLATGSYNVTLTAVTGFGCSDDTTKSVSVNPSPFVDFNSNSPCFIDSVSFTNLSSISSGSITGWQWIFGDGGTSNLQAPKYVYADTGNYSTTLIATSALGCSDSITKTVYVQPAPNAFFTSNIPCQNMLVSFKDSSILTSGSIVSWQWSFGDGNVSSLQNPTHIYSSTGNYSVSLIILSDLGCTDTIVKTLEVHEQPVADFNTNTPCYIDSVGFTDLTTIPTEIITSWQWSFGDGGTGTEQNPKHYYNTAGSFSTTLIATSNFGCTDTITKLINVQPAPVADFEVSLACSGKGVFFTDSSTIIFGSIVSWAWDFGDGNTSTAQNPIHVYPVVGSYNVTLIVTSSFGCTSTITKTIDVRTSPVADFAVNTPCYVDSVSFSDLSTIASGSIIGWQWNFGDGGTGTLQNPNHYYDTAGSYNTTLIVTSDFGCTDTVAKLINVQPAPVANFSASLACSGQDVLFTDSSTIIFGNIVSWAWDFGDGNTSTAQNPVHIYPIIGSYNVTLIATSSFGCTSTITKTIDVRTSPVADFMVNTPCYVDSVSFMNLTTIASGTIAGWEWDFGDGETETLQNPNHYYDTAGSYNTTLIATSDFGCTDTTTKLINVQPAPVADFESSLACSGQDVAFTDSSTIIFGSIVAWEWDFGDGNTSTAQNPIHVYPVVGSYNVTLIVTSSFGCTSTITKTIDVRTSPVADFAVNTPCYVDSVSFSDLSTIASGSIIGWQWNFGDGGTGTLQNPNHYYDTAGSYNTTLIVTSDFGCTDTVAKLINVQPAPVANFSASLACSGQDVSFTDSSTIIFGNIVSWAWDFGDGNTSTLQNPVHVYPVIGSYTVTLIATSSFGCTSTITKTIDVRTSPVADFTVNALCYIDSVPFTDLSTITSGSITSWQWNFGDGETGTLQNPNHYYDTAGSYNTTLIVTSNFGCTDTSIQAINVQPAPVTDFGLPVSCSNKDAQFTDLSTIAFGSIVSWAWDFGDGNSDTLQNPTNNFSTPGIYNVKLIVTSAFGCTDSLIQTMDIKMSPVAGFVADNPCFIDSVSFTNQSTISSGSIVAWEWNFGDGGTSTVENPAHLYDSSGTYTAVLIATSDFGCTDTSIQNINIQPLPIPDFSAFPVCENTVVTFNDSSTISSGAIVSWNWDFGDGNTDTLQNPQHTYTTQGTYNVTLVVVSDAGCTNTITKATTVNPLPVAAFLTNTPCYIDSVSFTDLSIVSSGNIDSWKWLFGDGDSSMIQNPNHYFVTPGTYFGTLIVTTTAGCTDTIVDTLDVNPGPKVDFTNNAVCLNGVTNFTDASTILFGSVVSWNWEFGDGASSSAQNPDHTYSSGGDFNVTLIVASDKGCIDTLIKTVTVDPLPEAGFISSGQCIDDGTQFTDTSKVSSGSIISWQYFFGDGAQSNLNNDLYHYQVAGNYGVTLIVETDKGCRDTVIEVVTVNPSPVADFTFNPPVVNMFQDVSFTDQSSGPVSWEWNFGDSITSTSTNPVHSYNSAGTVTVMEVVTNIFGCTDTIFKDLVVTMPPLVPNGFSPNGDGRNDILYVPGGPYSTINFRIYNNWGELIFVSNNQSLGWDGTRNGIIQPLGVYVFTLEATTEDGKEHYLKGDVTLLR